MGKLLQRLGRRGGEMLKEIIDKWDKDRFAVLEEQLKQCREENERLQREIAILERGCTCAYRNSSTE
jgi:hypothetical protein